MKQSQKPESVHAAMRRERSGASPAGAAPFTNVVVQAAVDDSMGAQNIIVRPHSHITGSPISAPTPTGIATGVDCIFTASENTAGIAASRPTAVTACENPSLRIDNSTTAGVKNAPRPKKKSRRLVA